MATRPAVVRLGVDAEGRSPVFTRLHTHVRRGFTRDSPKRQAARAACDEGRAEPAEQRQRRAGRSPGSGRW